MHEADNFRENLQHLIDSTSISKTRLAETAKTSRSYVDLVLKGDVEPGLTKAVALANSAGFSLRMMLESPKSFIEATQSVTA